MKLFNVEISYKIYCGYYRHVVVKTFALVFSKNKKEAKEFVRSNIEYVVDYTSDGWEITDIYEVKSENRKRKTQFYK